MVGRVKGWGSEFDDRVDPLKQAADTINSSGVPANKDSSTLAVGNSRLHLHGVKHPQACRIRLVTTVLRTAGKAMEKLHMKAACVFFDLIAGRPVDCVRVLLSMRAVILTSDFIHSGWAPVAASSLSLCARPGFWSVREPVDQEFLEIAAHHQVKT